MPLVCLQFVIVVFSDNTYYFCTDSHKNCMLKLQTAWSAVKPGYSALSVFSEIIKKPTNIGLTYLKSMKKPS